MKILKNNQIIITDCVVAKSFWNKLLGRFYFKGKPILLSDCNSIHTIFLKEKLDIFFLNDKNEIIKIRENIPPNCIIFPEKYTKYILETDAGFAKSAKIMIGDRLDFER